MPLNLASSMDVLREIRKAVTIGGLRVGKEIASRADDGGIVESMRWVMKGLTKAAIPLRTRLATNMKHAGIYRRGLVDEHFDRVIDQMAMLAHVFRAGFPNSGCPEKFVFDDSFKHLQQAYDLGKGVINIAPHICSYPIYPPIVSPRIPCAIYLRRGKDPRKASLNEAIGLAGKGELISPPPGATKPQRLQVAIDILRKGKLLFIAADTPRKSHEGAAVEIFGRTTYFPTGIFVMSLRTGAPVVPVWWHWEDGVYRIRYDEPIMLQRGRNLRGQAADAVQAWGRKVDAFFHEHPDMWWNWLDKRWTRIVRGQGYAAKTAPQN